MRKSKSAIGGEKKQKDSAVSINRRRKRPQIKNNNKNHCSSPSTPSAAATPTINEEYGTTTAYGDPLKPATFKSQVSPGSSKKLKKKIKNLKEQQQENENKVGESDNKQQQQQPQIEKPSTRIEARKKSSKGTHRRKKTATAAGGGEEETKEISTMRIRKKKSAEEKEQIKVEPVNNNNTLVPVPATPVPVPVPAPAPIQVPSAVTLVTVEDPPNNNNNKQEEEVVNEKSVVIDKMPICDGRIDWVQSCCTKRVKGIVKEFSKAKDYFPVMNFSVCNAHESKNRYADVLCADETRVVLKNRESADDYIHASWVCCPAPNSQRFICAQGPMEDSIIDFWQMIFQEKTPVIVMLCAITENGFDKCAQYWPPEVGNIVEHGNFKLENEKIEATDIDTIKCSTLKLENLKPQEGEEATLSILHYQWADWPDHVSPAEPGPAVELLKVVKEKAKSAPIVVHCSAGIGRTGTFCGIDYANDRIKSDSKVQMSEILQELRRQRVHSVQSNPQYVYIHLCLIHLLMETKVVFESDETKQFFADYKKYMDVVRQKVEKNSRKSSKM